MSSSSDSDLELLQMLSDLDDMDESDDSSISEDAVDTPPVQVGKRKINYPKTLEAKEFLLRFRLDKTQVECLLGEIYPYLRVTGSRNNGTSPLHQLLLALRFYAVGSSAQVGQFIGVSNSTAYRIIRDVSYAITHLYSKYIYVNNTTEEFYKIAKFPHVLGVIDCTHIKINYPGSKEYKNLKGSYSINVQAVCDANSMFINLESKWPGSTHDATVFENSVFKVQCESKAFGNKWLLGDNAYPLKQYLLTAIENPKNKSEKLYNESHKKTRHCIVRCFELWKRRFPVLTQVLRTNVTTSNSIVIATAILHNICIMHSVEEVPSEVNNLIEEEIPVPDAQEVIKNQILKELLVNHFNE